MLLSYYIQNTDDYNNTDLIHKTQSSIDELKQKFKQSDNPPTTLYTKQQTDDKDNESLLLEIKEVIESFLQKTNVNKTDFNFITVQSGIDSKLEELKKLSGGGHMDERTLLKKYKLRILDSELVSYVCLGTTVEVDKMPYKNTSFVS